MKLSFGASGNLTNQIRNGAPFDVFFSADEAYPQQLIAEGLAPKDTLYRYASDGLCSGCRAIRRWICEARDAGAARPIGEKDFDCESVNGALRPRRGSCIAALRNLRSGFEPPRRRRERFAGSAVCRIGNAQAGLIALSHALAQR